MSEMYQEKPLYTSVDRGIAVPGFAAFCRGFRGARTHELYVREDGTGLYLRAGGRSIDLVYKQGSFSGALLGKKGSEHRQLNIFPFGKEADVKHLPVEELVDTDVAVEHPNVIRSMINTLYEGKEIEEAVIEPMRGLVINMGGFRVPEDTAFFEPSPIAVRFADDRAVFFMESKAFLQAVCEDSNGKTVYVPREADR